MAPAVQSNHVWVGEVVPRPGFLRRWEYRRHRQVHHAVELFSEFMGVFFYTWIGIGSTITFALSNITQQPGLSSIFQVGAAYGIGIVMALSVCVATSGGHINPCITITFALFRGFPWKKVPTYIAAQILGAYVACFVAYLQYKDVIHELEGALMESGKYEALQFTPQGVAGAFALYANPGKPLGLIFFNEFAVDVLLATVIWAALDPSNFIATPVSGPWIVGLAYAAAIWGYGPANLAANSARDIGSRLFALTIWGKPAAGGAYAAIAALTNIPATIIAFLGYEFIHWDSNRHVAPGQLAQLTAHKAHLQRIENMTEADFYSPPGRSLEPGFAGSSSSSGVDDKPHIDMRE